MAGYRFWREDSNFDACVVSLETILPVMFSWLWVVLCCYQRETAEERPAIPRDRIFNCILNVNAIVDIDIHRLVVVVVGFAFFSISRDPNSVPIGTLTRTPVQHLSFSEKKNGSTSRSAHDMLV